MTEVTHEICEVTGHRHEADWTTITRVIDGDVMCVDVYCKHCGRLGYLSTEALLQKLVEWG